MSLQLRCVERILRNTQNLKHVLRNVNDKQEMIIKSHVLESYKNKIGCIYTCESCNINDIIDNDEDDEEYGGMYCNECESYYCETCKDDALSFFEHDTTLKCKCGVWHLSYISVCKSCLICQICNCGYE